MSSAPATALDLRQSGDLSTLHFSSDALPACRRVAAWREFFGRAIVRLDIDSLDDDKFRSEGTLRVMPGLGLVAGSAAALRFHRPRHLIDEDDVAFSILLSGESRFSVRGRETILRAGEAIVMGAGEGGTNEARVNCRFVAMRVPRRAISTAAPKLNDLIGVPMPARTPGLRLLTHYVKIFEDAQALADPQVRHQAVTHVHDLIAVLLGATREASEIIDGRGVRAARLAAIKQDIAGHLAGDLSIGAAAARHGLTPRTVQRLFEAEGTTFSEYVLEQRLAQAHRLLSDVGRAAEKISAIAFATGFPELSHFNRAFRRHYGVTPSEVRAQACGGWVN
jgi:AraC-like DNA-binding protein